MASGIDVLAKIACRFAMVWGYTQRKVVSASKQFGSSAKAASAHEKNRDGI
jgi:hypothetical protein